MKLKVFTFSYLKRIPRTVTLNPQQQKTTFFCNLNVIFWKKLLYSHKFLKNMTKRKKLGQTEKLRWSDFFSLLIISLWASEKRLTFHFGYRQIVLIGLSGIQLFRGFALQSERAKKWDDLLYGICVNYEDC